MKNDKKIQLIYRICILLYPNSKCTLNYNTVFQLLVATILSAQCNDKIVNKVTKILFEKYKEPKDYINANINDIKYIIKFIGLYNVKATYLINASKVVFYKFNNIVPNTLQELMTIPGVGRKVANVVLANGYNIPAIAVDTHVSRIISRILGIKRDTYKIEKLLCANLDSKMYKSCSNALIEYGRNICLARKPKCNMCDMKLYCNYYQQNSI